MGGRIENSEAREEALRSSLEAALLEGARHAKRAVRRRVLAAVREDARFKPYRVAAARASAMLVVVTVVASGASVAAAKAVPGQPAYALKRAAERTALAVLPEGALRDALARVFVQRRAYELRELMRAGLSDADLRAALESMGLAGPMADDPHDALRRELERIEPSTSAGPTHGGAAGGAEQRPPAPVEGPSHPVGPGTSDGAGSSPSSPSGGEIGSHDREGSGSMSRDGVSKEPSGQTGPGTGSDGLQRQPSSQEPSPQPGPGSGPSPKQPDGGSTEPTQGSGPIPDPQPGRGQRHR